MPQKIELLNHTILFAHFKSSDTYQARVWKGDVPLEKFVGPSEKQALEAAESYITSGRAAADFPIANQTVQEKKDAIRASAIERHKGYMDEHGFEYQGVADSSLGPSFVMFPVCWRCSTGLDLLGVTCRRCRRYVCRACGACRCGFQAGDSHFLRPEA